MSFQTPENVCHMYPVNLLLQLNGHSFSDSWKFSLCQALCYTLETTARKHTVPGAGGWLSELQISYI